MTTNSHGDTLLVLVVDRSGSMQTIRDDMEGGIAALLKEQAQQPGKCRVTLAQFDTEYELVWRAVPIAEIDHYQLMPRGNTALLDALGRTIGEVKSELAALPAVERPEHIVFAVVTDGMENASTEWTRDKVMSAVKEQMDAGWHFTFLGANQDAIREGGNLGMVAAASLTYDAAPDASRAAMTALSASVARLRTGAAKDISYTDAERRRSRKKK